MNYKTQTAVVFERPHVREGPQIVDDSEKSNLNYEIREIKNDKRAAKGIVFGFIFAIPIWILIISFIIWVIP